MVHDYAPMTREQRETYMATGRAGYERGSDHELFGRCSLSRASKLERYDYGILTVMKRAMNYYGHNRPGIYSLR